MNNIENFINLLTEEPPSIYHKSTEDFINIEYKASEFTLLFCLHYEVNVYDYLSADNSNPEEFELEFENTEIDELELYKNDDPIELTTKEINSIYKILYKQLIN